MQSKSKNKHFPILVLFAVNFMWGLDFLIIEYLVQFQHPNITSFVKLAIAAIVLVSLAFYKEGGIRIAKKDWPRVIFCGATGLSLYYGIETVGVSLSSGAIAALVMATVPMIGMLADRIVYKNPITLYKFLCILASIVGVVILILGGGSGGLKASPLGIILMLLAAILWTAFIVAVKPLHENYSEVTILAGMGISGLVMSTILVLPVLNTPMTWTPKVVGLSIVSAIVATVMGEFGYVYSVGRLSVTLVALFENVLPIVSVIFAFLVFGQTMTGMQLVGAVIIIGSVTAVIVRE